MAESLNDLFPVQENEGVAKPKGLNEVFGEVGTSEVATENPLSLNMLYPEEEQQEGVATKALNFAGDVWDKLPSLPDTSEIVPALESAAGTVKDVVAQGDEVLKNAFGNITEPLGGKLQEKKAINLPEKEQVPDDFNAFADTVSKYPYTVDSALGGAFRALGSDSLIQHPREKAQKAFSILKDANASLFDKVYNTYSLINSFMPGAYVLDALDETRVMFLEKLSVQDEQGESPAERLTLKDALMRTGTEMSEKAGTKIAEGRPENMDWIDQSIVAATNSGIDFLTGSSVLKMMKLLNTGSLVSTFMAKDWLLTYDQSLTEHGDPERAADHATMSAILEGLGETPGTFMLMKGIKGNEFVKWLKRYMATDATGEEFSELSQLGLEIANSKEGQKRSFKENFDTWLEEAPKTAVITAMSSAQTSSFLGGSFAATAKAANSWNAYQANTALDKIKKRIRISDAETLSLIKARAKFENDSLAQTNSILAETQTMLEYRDRLIELGGQIDVYPVADGFEETSGINEIGNVLFHNNAETKALAGLTLTDATGRAFPYAAKQNDKQVVFGENTGQDSVKNVIRETQAKITSLRNQQKITPAQDLSEEISKEQDKLTSLQKREQVSDFLRTEGIGYLRELQQNFLPDLGIVFTDNTVLENGNVTEHEGTNGHLAILPDNNATIMLSPLGLSEAVELNADGTLKKINPNRIMEDISHEFGHAMAWELLAKSPIEVQVAIKKAYEAYRQKAWKIYQDPNATAKDLAREGRGWAISRRDYREGYGKKMSAQLDLAIQKKTKQPGFDSFFHYAYSFDEWFAHEMERAYLGSSLVNKVARNHLLRNTAVVKSMHDKAKKIYNPSEIFETLLKYAVRKTEESNARSNVQSLRKTPLINSVAYYYLTPEARELAHAVKNGNQAAILQMAKEMATIIPKGMPIIPMPSHTGKATVTKQLADAIAQINGSQVHDILQGELREAWYDAKKEGKKGFDFGFHINGVIPNDTSALIDTVYDTGETMKQAQALIPSAVPFVHSRVETPKLPEDAVAAANNRAVESIGNAINNVTKSMNTIDLVEQIKNPKAELDTFNKFIANVYTLTQIANENPHIPELQNYVREVELWWAEKSKWNHKALETAEAWLGAKGKDTADRIAKFALAVTLESDNLGRALTSDELQEINQKKQHQLDDDAFGIWEQIDQDFRDALGFDMANPQGLYRALLADVHRVHANNAEKAMEAVLILNKEMTEMSNRNFFPLSRFGRYVVYVKATDDIVLDGLTYNKGETVAFEAFEDIPSQKVAMTEYKNMLAGKSVHVKPDTLSDTGFAYANMPPNLIKAMQTQLGLSVEQQEELDDILLKQTTASRYKKHLLRRSGVPGFSQDALRGYTSYMANFANAVARMQYAPNLQAQITQLENTVDAISRQKGKSDSAIVDEVNKRNAMVGYLTDHFEYVMNPGNELANLRSVAFTFYLGFMPASAAGNLSQLVMATWPYLSETKELGGSSLSTGAVAAMQLTKAMKDVMSIYKGKTHRFSKDENEMFEMLVARGILDESQAQELAGFSEGSNLQRMMPDKWGFGKFKTRKAAGVIRNITYAGAFLFHHAEKFNRNITALAAFRMAREQGMDVKAAIDAAHVAVRETQFEYARWNRPKIMRGKKSIVFMFQMFVENMLYFMGRGNGGRRAILLFFLVNGLSGGPGSEDMMDIYDFLVNKWNKFFGDKGARSAIREDVRELVQEIGLDPNMVMHGVGSKYGLGPIHLLEYAGIPVPNVNISGRLSMGRVIPGLGPLLQPDQETYGRATAEASGAVIGMGLGALSAASSDNPDKWKNWEKAMPAAIRYWSQASRFLAKGEETRYNGGTLMPFNLSDPLDVTKIGLHAAGFQNTQLSHLKERDWAQKQMLDFFSTRKSQILRQYATAILAKDREGKADMKKAVRNYNDSVPHSSLKISGTDVGRNVARTVKARKMGERGLPVSRKAIPAARGLNELYPIEEEGVR